MHQDGNTGQDALGAAAGRENLRAKVQGQPLASTSRPRLAGMRKTTRRVQDRLTRRPRSRPGTLDRASRPPGAIRRAPGTGPSGPRPEWRGSSPRANQSRCFPRNRPRGHRVATGTTPCVPGSAHGVLGPCHSSSRPPLGLWRRYCRPRSSLFPAPRYW